MGPWVRKRLRERRTRTALTLNMLESGCYKEQERETLQEDRTEGRQRRNNKESNNSNMPACQ